MIKMSDISLTVQGIGGAALIWSWVAWNACKLARAIIEYRKG